MVCRQFYSVIMILQFNQNFTVCYYDFTVLLWNPILIMEFQNYHGIPVSLWNSSLIMEFIKRHENGKKQLLRLLERACSQTSLKSSILVTFENF